MSKISRILLVIALAFAIVVLGGYAIHGQVRAAAYKVQLENYQRHAFAELTAAAGALDNALQKAVYATPGPLRDSLLQQVYAKALAAQEALGELPCGNVELEHTAAFFAKVGDYAAALCRKGGDESTEGLVALAAISHTLNSSLGELEMELEADAFSLAGVGDAEKLLSKQVEPKGQENEGMSFQRIEADFPEMPTLVYDGPFSEHMTGERPKALEGMVQVTERQAREKAAGFLGCPPDNLTLTSNGTGEIPVYGFTLPRAGGLGYIEITCQGGQILEYFCDCSVKEETLTVEKGEKAALAFLQNWGFTEMKASYHILRDGRLTIHFAPVKEDVYCYPDLVKVTVSLADGTLLGYEAHGYLNQHRERNFHAYSVTVEDASAAVQNGLTILTQQKALIPTAGGTDEMLTYEFKCQSQDGSHILIYVNGETGEQQNILLLLEDESGTLTL